MHSDREYPLYHLDAETLLVATYIWVDEAFKALKAQGIRLPKPQRHQKATLSELSSPSKFGHPLPQNLHLFIPRIPMLGDHWKRAARFPSDEGCHAPDGPSSTLDPPGPPANPPPPGVPQSPALPPPHRPRQSQAPAQQDQVPLLLTQIPSFAT